MANDEESQGAAGDDARHSLESSLREKLLEHLFVGELLKHLWRQGRQDIEVLRAEVDRGGYDLVLGCGMHLRHVQLKASHRTARTPSVNVNNALAAKPSGCVIWIRFDEQTLDLGPFYWFGSELGHPLPDLGDRIARHTRANRAGKKNFRPNHRELGKQRFARLDTIGDVATALFGA